MSSNDCKNEITLTSRYYLDSDDKFKSLEEAIREVSYNMFYLEEAVKEIQEKIDLLVTQKKNVALK